MDKKDIINLLTLNNYSFKETEKGINVKITRHSCLLLLFNGDKFILYKEKVKIGLRWISLSSMLWNIPVGFFILLY